MTPQFSVGAEQVAAHLKACTESREELLAALKELRGELYELHWWTAKNFGWPQRSARIDAVIAHAEASRV